MKAVAICIGLVFIGLILTNLGHAAIDLENAVGVWLFDEGSGNTVKDTSGNGNDGELQKDPKWVQGIFGKALEFAGDNYVQIPSSPVLDSGEGDMTYTAWVKTDIAGRLYIYHNSGSGSEKAEWVIVDGKIRLYVREAGGANTWRDSATPLNDGKWHLATTVWRGSESPATIEHYLDGAPDSAEGYGSQGIAGQELVFAGPEDVIGIRHNDWITGFEGAIDEFAIFNVALEEDDIPKLEGGLQGIFAVSPSGKLASIWGAVKVR